MIPAHVQVQCTNMHIHRRTCTYIRSLFILHVYMYIVYTIYYTQTYIHVHVYNNNTCIKCSYMYLSSMRVHVYAN